MGILENLRHGQFRFRETAFGTACQAIEVLDADADGRWEMHYVQSNGVILFYDQDQGWTSIMNPGSTTLIDYEIGDMDGDGSIEFIGAYDDGVYHYELGQDGLDTLTGDTGNDTLTGGSGVDQMTGDLGDDIFLFTSVADSGIGSGNRDIISDFTVGADSLDISATASSLTFIGTDAFTGTGNEVRYTQSGGNTIVQLDSNANAATDMEIELMGLLTLDSGDFTL